MFYVLQNKNTGERKIVEANSYLDIVNIYKDWNLLSSTGDYVTASKYLNQNTVTSTNTGITTNTGNTVGTTTYQQTTYAVLVKDNKVLLYPVSEMQSLLSQGYSVKFTGNYDRAKTEYDFWNRLLNPVIPKTPVPESPVSESPVSESPVSESPVIPKTPISDSPDNSKNQPMKPIDDTYNIDDTNVSIKGGLAGTGSNTDVIKDILDWGKELMTYTQGKQQQQETIDYNKLYETTIKALKESQQTTDKKENSDNQTTSKTESVPIVITTGTGTTGTGIIQTQSIFDNKIVIYGFVLLIIILLLK